MAAKHQGRSAPRRLFFSVRSSALLVLWASPVLIAGLCLLYFAMPNPAQSQINHRLRSAPKFSSESSPGEDALPKAPVQVQLSAPPPIRYVPGWRRHWWRRVP
jgi:hypothetical protein